MTSEKKGDTEKESPLDNNNIEKDKDRNEKEGLSNIWKNFAATTTAHGFSHLTISTNTTVRMLWVSVIIACQVLLYVQIHPLVVRYLQKPTKTKLYLKQEPYLVFPIVTVCNTNPIKASRVIDLELYPEFKDRNYFSSQSSTTPQPATSSQQNTTTGTGDGGYENAQKQNSTNDVINNDKDIVQQQNTTADGGDSNGDTGDGGVKNEDSAPENKTSKKRKRKSLLEEQEKLSRNGNGKKQITKKKRFKREVNSPWSFTTASSIKGASGTTTQRVAERKWKPPTQTFEDKETEFDAPSEEEMNVYTERIEMLSQLGNIAQNYKEQVFELGYQQEELIKECKWKDFYDCTPAKWWTPVWHYRFGNCYAFNMPKGDGHHQQNSSSNSSSSREESLLRVTGAGPDQGLKLKLRLNQEEYVDGHLVETAAIVMHIGEQGGRIEPYLNGISLAPNFEHNIALSRTEIVRADPFNNGSCASHERVDLGARAFSNQYISRYSVHACRDICLAQTQLDHCGCTSYWLPSLRANRTCSEVDSLCAKKYLERFINGQLSCLEACRQPCQETKYDVQSSFRCYPIKARKPTSQVEQEEDENLKVHVYFKTMETQVIEDEEYYFMENLLGDIGGQLGLFSGVSALTVVELIFFLSNTLIAVAFSLKWVCVPGFKNTVHDFEMGSANCKT